MVAPGAAGGENVSNDIGVTADGENNESDASTAKVTPPQRGSMQVVIQFETDEMASTVDVVATDKFGPARFEPPGVRYEKVEQTNAYRRTYNRTYVEGSMLWRLKTVKVGTMQNGQVGGAGNWHSITHLSNVIIVSLTPNREHWRPHSCDFPMST